MVEHLKSVEVIPQLFHHGHVMVGLLEALVYNLSVYGESSTWCPRAFKFSRDWNNMTNSLVVVINWHILSQTLRLELLRFSLASREQMDRDSARRAGDKFDISILWKDIVVSLWQLMPSTYVIKFFSELNNSWS